MDNFLTYKGKPLVRNDKEIYYGDMAEKYVIRFIILSEKEQDGQKIADRVAVQLMLSDTQLKEADRIKKKSEKNGLYEALDLGAVWLDRALKE